MRKWVDLTPKKIEKKRRWNEETRKERSKKKKWKKKNADRNENRKEWRKKKQLTRNAVKQKLGNISPIHTLSISVWLSHTLSLPPPPSLWHTHKHTHTHTQNLSFPHTLSISLSLSLTCTTPAFEGFFLSPQLPVARQYFIPSVITLKSKNGNKNEIKHRN